jgi:hypothetical protein
MGIPLFLESRLEVALSGGGIGLFIRLADTPRYITLFMAFYIVFYDKSKFHKYYAFCYFAVSIMVFVLSGSKSTFLVIIQLFGIFVFFNQSRCKRALEIYKKDMLKYFIVCLIFAFLVIFMQNAVNVFWGIMSFFMRLVASGDVYYFAYTNDNITKLPKTDLFIFLFGDFLRTVRLIPQNTRGLGYILNDIVHDTENSVVGPTIRFNVEGYVNFGFFGSMIFSFFCAWILATSRNFFIKSRNATAYIQLLAVVLYKNSIPIETGPSVTFSYFTTDVFLTGLICVYVYFITRYCKVRI